MTDNNNTKKLGVTSIVLMIFSIIFGFGNTAVAFLRMGYASIVWYIFGALIFFLPFMFISAEYAASFKGDGGGIYTWMRKSRGELYGFTGTFMWYFSIIIWLVGISARIWVPISSALFGEDKTTTWRLFGLENSQTLGIIGILLILSVTFLATKGFNKLSIVAKIGGIACAIINVLLYITSLTVLILNKGAFAEPIKGIESFIKSPNPDHTTLTLFGFVTFAIFAYGGIEGLGSLVDKAKSARIFSKACVVATIFIAFGYSVAIFLWGVSSNYDELVKGNHSMGNITYILMRNLGFKLAQSFGGSLETCIATGKIFMRIVGLSMALGFLGALFTLIYSPIKTLIDGAPEKMWPSFLTKMNKANMPQNALWLQAAVVCTIVAIIALFGKALKTFFEVLQLLSNIGQCIPYIFIIAAFPAFRKNDSLDHEYTILKSKTTATVVSIISAITITVAVIFTMLDPALSKTDKDGMFKTLCMLIFPAVFFIFAFLIFNSYKKRVSNE